MSKTGHGQEFAHALALGHQRIAPVEVGDHPCRLINGGRQVQLGLGPALALGDLVHQQVWFDAEPRG